MLIKEENEYIIFFFKEPRTSDFNYFLRLISPDARICLWKINDINKELYGNRRLLIDKIIKHKRIFFFLAINIYISFEGNKLHIYESKVYFVINSNIHFKKCAILHNIKSIKGTNK